MEFDDNRYSYIRAVREVVQDIELVKFLANVGRIGSQVFGYRDSTLLRHLASPHEELAEDYVAVHDGVGVEAVEVYKANSLRLTHFERRARVAAGMNNVFSRVYDRMSVGEAVRGKSDVSTEESPKVRPEYWLQTQLPSICDNYGFDVKRGLVIRIDGIIESTQREYAHLGAEYALHLEPNATASMLTEQSKAIHRTIQQIGPGHSLAGRYVELPLAIPFVRLPAEAEVNQIEIFTEWVEYEMPLKRLYLAPLEWQAKNRS